MPGICTGTKIDLKQQLNCEDADFDDPQCKKCQEMCLSCKDCSGFYVNLDKKNRWSECFFKKGKVAVKTNHYTKKYNVCYRKGNEY